jgi:hypothetical protein
MNVILGTAINYNKEQLKPFVNSWKLNCSSVDLVLVVSSSIDDITKHWLLSNNVKLRYFSSVTFLPMPIYWSRFLCYLDFLLEEHKQYKKVFLTDVRDVVFQKNIFDDITKDGFHVFMEDDKYTCSQENNRKMLMSVFGESVADSLKNNKIICSGTILGDPHLIIQYIKTMFTMISVEQMLGNSGYSDQAAHNYLCHYKIIKNIQHENGDGVATLVLTDSNDVKIVDGVVHVYDKVPSVLHQWDFQPCLLDYVKKYTYD